MPASYAHPAQSSQRILPTIRRAALADLPVVQACFGALHHEHALLDHWFALADGWEHHLHHHFTTTCTAPDHCWLLAWVDPTPVGLLVLAPHTDPPLFRHRHWAELVALYVSPAYRGTGVADQLIAIGSAWACQAGFARVQLYVAQTNHPAHACYTRAGFAPVQQIWRLAFEEPSEMDP